MIDDPYVFLELDEVTREFMISELEFDIAANGYPYRGKGTLTARGVDDYAALLRTAIATGSEVDLVAALKDCGRVEEVPVDAARRLGRTEFNRYYIRGICLRANAHGTNSVVVYRAHGAAAPRSGSQDMVGREHSAPRILANIRGSQGMDTETGLGRVNSGISVRCGCLTCLGDQT